MAVTKQQRGTVIDLDSRRPTRTLVHRKKRIRAQVLPFRLRGNNEGRPVLMRDAVTLPPLLDGLVLLPNVSSQGRGIVIPPIEDGFKGKGLHVPDSAGDKYSRQGRPMIPVTGKPTPRTIRPMGRGVAPTRFKNEFAERLKAARIAAGYSTQQEFASALGVPIERYKKWESGRTPMPHQYIPAACELTGQDANYFFKVTARAIRKTA
jgi:DNA-binding XRE family transcriptional regulator